MQKSMFNKSQISLVLLFSFNSNVMLTIGFYLFGSKTLSVVSLGLNLPVGKSEYSASSRFVTFLHECLRAVEAICRLLSTTRLIVSAAFFYTFSGKHFNTAFAHSCITHFPHDANRMHSRWNGGAMASATSRHPAANVPVTR